VEVKVKVIVMRLILMRLILMTMTRIRLMMKTLNVAGCGIGIMGFRLHTTYSGIEQ
jgi:hypothetical protein